MVNVHLFKSGLAVFKAALKADAEKLLNRSFFIARGLRPVSRFNLDRYSLQAKKFPDFGGNLGRKSGYLSLLYEDASISLKPIIGKADFRIMCVLVV